METYYKKLYTKTITLPIIPYEGITSDTDTAYYAVLEKNYIPIESEIKNINNSWLNIKFSKENDTYNKLIIASAEPNTEDKLRESIIEVKSTENRANSIYVVVKQEPKIEIGANIELEPLTDTQILNDKTLTIDGDEQIVKIIYYGTRNGDLVTGNCELKINGNRIYFDSDNVISLKSTGYGNVLLYKFPENIEHQNEYTINCKYTNEYGRTSDSEQSTIVQKVNTYTFSLMYNGSDTDTIINDNSQNITIECMYEKNSISDLTNIHLIYAFNDDEAHIITKDYISEVNDTTLIFKIPIEPNYTNNDRVIHITAIKNKKKSNTLKITQQKINSYEIIAEFNNKTYKNYIREDIPGKQLSSYINYYVKGTYNDNTTVQFTTYTNIYNNKTETTTLDITNDSKNIVKKIDSYISNNYNTAYILIPENKSDSIITYDFNINFGITHIFNVKFNHKVITLNINIKTDLTTTEIHGLKEFNKVQIAFYLQEDSEYVSNIIDTKIEFENQYINLFELEKFEIKKDENKIYYMLYTYNILEDYGINSLTNDDNTVRTIKYNIIYKRKSISSSITQNPVWFNYSSEMCTITTNTVSGKNDERTYITAYGLICNSERDQEHFIKDPNVSFKLKYEGSASGNNEPLNTVQSYDGYNTKSMLFTDIFGNTMNLYSASSVPSSDSDSSSDGNTGNIIVQKDIGLAMISPNINKSLTEVTITVLFKKNNTGKTKWYGVYSEFKGLKVAKDIQQYSVAVSAVLLINDDDKPIHILKPWQSTTYDLKAYIIEDDTKLKVTNAIEGTITNSPTPDSLTRSYNLRLDTTSKKFQSGVLTQKFKYDKTYTYVPLDGIIKLNYKVTHGSKNLTSNNIILYSYNIDSLKLNKNVFAYDDIATKTSFYDVICPDFINGTTDQTVIVKAKVLYSVNAIEHADPQNTAIGKFTITCESDQKLFEPLENGIQNGYYFQKFNFFVNSDIKPQEHKIKLIYENKRSTSPQYNRSVTKELVIEQSAAEWQVDIAFDYVLHSFNKELDGMEHDNAYIFVCISDENARLKNVNPSKVTFNHDDNIAVKFDFYMPNDILRYKIVTKGNNKISYNFSGNDIINNITATFSKRNSNQITLCQHDILNEYDGIKHVKVYLNCNKTSILNTGDNVLFTYYATYDSTVLPLPVDDWNIVSKLDGTSVTLIDDNTSTLTHIKKSYTFEENSTSNDKKLNTYVYYRNQNIKSDTIIVNQVSASYDLFVNISNDMLSAGGQDFTLTYYGLINAKTRVTDVNSITCSHSYTNITNKSKNTNDTVVTDIKTISENDTEEVHEYTFIVSYKVSSTLTITKEVKFKQAANEFSCELLLNNSKDTYVVNPFEGETLTFTYYGIKNAGVHVTDKSKLSIKSDNGSLTFKNINVVGDVLNADLIIPKNTEAVPRTFKIWIEYLYNTSKEPKISNTIKLTQDISEYDIKMIIKTDYVDDNGNNIINKEGSVFKVYYYGYNNSAPDTMITTLEYFNEPLFSQFDDYTMFDCDKTSGPQIEDGMICCTYTVKANDANTGFNDSKYVMVKVQSANLPDKYSENIIMQKGDEIILPDFDYFAFKYSFLSGGVDLDTATSIRADNDNNIYEVGDDGRRGNALTKDKFVGYSGIKTFKYMMHYGDNISDSGKEAVTINLRKIIENSKLNPATDLKNIVVNSIYIDIFGSWYSIDNGGKIAIEFETYKGTTGFSQVSILNGYNTREYVANSGMVRNSYEAKEVTVRGKGEVSKYRDTYAHFARVRYNLKTNIAVLEVAESPVYCNGIGGPRCLFTECNCLL